MLKRTKVKPGTLVKLAPESFDDPMYQMNLWEDYIFLRDPTTLKILGSTWVKNKELCIVVGSDYTGLIVMNPRGQLGWIGKEKMEVVK